MTTSSDVPDPAEFLGDRRYLIDNSFFGRVAHPAIAPIWAEGLERDLFVACSPFVAEALQSVETAREVRGLRAELTGGLPYVEPDGYTWELAYDAQETMADVSLSWHRASPVDFLLAAIASREELVVLHYDHDYDKIQADAGLAFQAKWVAPPGSLEEAGEQRQVVRQLKRAISARLRRFTGEDEEERIHRDFVSILDQELEEAGKPALPPPT